MLKKDKYNWLKFLGCLFFVSLVWLVILPRIAETPKFQAYRSFLDERKINPEAMYYSDLESMPDVLNRLDESK